MYNKRRFGFRYGKDNPRKAICADCGQETEVPFQPCGRVAYCRECYQNHIPKRY